MDITSMTSAQLKTLIKNARNQLKSAQTAEREQKKLAVIKKRLDREAKREAVNAARETKKAEMVQKNNERLAKLEAKLAKLKANATPATSRQLRMKGAAV